MAEFENMTETIVDVTRPAFEGIEDLAAREVGAMGEALAASFLEDRGYELVDRNWETPFGEADIIARNEDGLIFVEVKSRRLLGFPYDEAPEAAVGKDKFTRYAKMAEFFKTTHGEVGSIRFDVVGITFLSNRIAHIAHLSGGYWWDE